MKYDFFITYHDDDEMAARWIAAVLKEEGFSTISESWAFLPGDTSEEKLLHTFETCRGVMVLLSSPILQSGFTPEAVRGVLEIVSANKRILFIPVLVRPCYLTSAWGSIAVMNLVDVKEKEARKQLIHAAAGRAGKESIPEPTQPTGKTRDDILKKRELEYKELLVKTIKNNYHMKLNLEHEVEKVVEVKNERTGEMEKRKELVWEKVDLETVLTDRNDYILVNPSGMGKTTFLTYAACVLLGPSKNYSFIPLFTTCIALNNREGSIETFLTERLDSFYCNSETCIIDTEWKNLCLLIDALDQAKNVDDIVSSLQIHEKYGHYKKAKIILSSRQNTADRVKEGFRKIRLQLPGEDEILHYLGKENYKKLESLIESSRELIAVPVLLEMLKTISESGHISSKLVNRSGLYTEFTRILIDQERRKPRFWPNASFIRHFIDCELEEVLEKIAFFSLVDNEILEIYKEKLLKYCESLEKKEELLNIGIILEIFEDWEQKMVFRHQSFQAYFAARYMYYRRPDLFRKLTSDIRFFYSDVWYEVMRFFVGLERDPEKTDKIIDSIYKTNVISKTFKKCDVDYALRLIFAFFLMYESRVSDKKALLFNEQIKNLIIANKGYFIFINSNMDKFNRENADQLKSFTGIFESLLRDKNWNVRGTAFEALGKISTANAISLLENLLKDENKCVRSAAAEALGNIGTANDIHLLEPLIRDKYDNVRSAAAKALGNIGTANDIHLLEPLIRDKYNDVREAAAESLGNIGTVKDFPLLESLIRDRDIRVRSTATESFLKIVTSNDIPLLKSLFRYKYYEVRCAAVEALGEIGTAEDIHLLESLLRDGYHEVRCAAVEALGKIGTANDIHLLESLLRDECYEVRCAAVEALGKIGIANDIHLLKPLLRDKVDYVRSAAAEAFVKIVTSNDIPPLKFLFWYKYYEVRCAAVKALGKIGTANDIPLLEPLLRDENESVRHAAVEALGKIGTTNDIPLLEPLLRHKKEWDRYAAVEALGNIGTATNIRLLVPLLRDNSELVRGAVAGALVKIGTANVIPLLKPLLRDDIDFLKGTVAEALGNLGTVNDIPLLEHLFWDMDDYVRGDADAFGKIGTQNDIPLLERLLLISNSNVLGTVAEILDKIGTSNPILLLEHLLRAKVGYVRIEAAEELGRIGTANDIHQLEPLLRDNDYYVRKVATKALGNIGTSKETPLLEPLLRDENESVRHTAIEALGKIGTSKEIPLLEPLLREEFELIRRAAAEALGKIATANDVPFLEHLLRDENEWVRHTVFDAVGNVDTEKDIDPLEYLIMCEDYSIDVYVDVQNTAADAIERIYKRSTPRLVIDDTLPRRVQIEPISYSPCSTHPLHILHISDIHYSKKHHPDIGRIFHEFLEDLTKWRQQQNNEKIRAVCLTGDIAYEGNHTQYDSMNKKINTILSTAGCSNDDLFMVPGNHDVQDYHILSHQGQQILKDAWKDQNNINFNVLNDFQNYREFHEKFTHYYGFIEKYGYQNSRSEIHNGISKPWYSRTLKDYPVRVIGLNSALFCLKDFNEYGKIRMGSNQFTEAYFQGKSGHPSNGELVILLTHHPLNWLWETEYEEFSTLLERYAVIHLHGHIHRLKIWNLFSFSGSSYLSVGTGSLYGVKGTEDINTYHILTFDFEKKEVHIWARRWVPELGRWAVYADETRNTFPFPQPNIYINQAIV